jgi:pimeloyl-ACP methyl ester carboxylesterase
MKHLYLHGFASGPGSRKAVAFAGLLQQHGISLDTPDLNLPSFAHLTLTAMVQEAEKRIADQTVLFGSSLGGYLAALLAQRHPQRVQRLVLLAPAVEFPEAFPLRSAAGLPIWKAGGTVPVHHHAERRALPFSGDLLGDCAKWPSRPRVGCPTLVFAGRADALIPLETIERWVAQQPHAQLLTLDDGHELTATLPAILKRSADFLGLNALT